MRPIHGIIFLLIPIMIVAIAIMQPFVDPRLLMLDAMVAAEESGNCCKTYYGLISTLGILGWFSTAAVCAFAAIVLSVVGGSKVAVQFALIAALLTGVLGVDDAFLFHENIAPKLGIQQNVVLGFYGLMACVFAIYASRLMQRESLILFVIAGMFLAMSMGLDVVWHSTDSLVVSLEDGAKFIGICCWYGALSTAMKEQLVQAVGRNRDSIFESRFIRTLDTARQSVALS